jgi:DNA invertase Pin-like site-specific DNA recombinase
MTPKEAIKGRQVYVYARVSTTKQRKTLPTQIKEVEQRLKSLGYKGEPKVYSEQKSGTTIERPALLKMIKDIKASKKDSIVVVRDIQRIARNTRLYGYLTYPWINEEIPILSLQESIITQTKKHPSPQGELLAGIFISAGGQEVDTRKKQTESGKVAARKEGIVPGMPMNLYYKDALNPIRELVEGMRIGINQSEMSRRVGRSKSWAKDTNNKIKLIQSKGGNKMVDEWLDVTDLIRIMEQQNGPRTGKKSSERMIAVGRKTSGYLKFPWEFPAPTQDDLLEYFTDYKKYLSKSTR